MSDKTEIYLNSTVSKSEKYILEFDARLKIQYAFDFEKETETKRIKNKYQLLIEISKR